MADYRDSAVAYLRLVIERTGKTPSELAEMVGASHTTFTRPLSNPDYKYAPKFPKLQRLEELTGVPFPADLINQTRNKSPSVLQFKALPIRGRVAAGLWLETDLLVDEPLGEAPMVEDPSYAGLEQWAVILTGPSMNRHYEDGDFLHVVSTIDIRHQFEVDDHVIVERHSADGKIERTCKRVIAVHPRLTVAGDSTDPRWNLPLVVDDLPEGTDVVILGLVVGSYRPRKRRTI